MTACDTTHAPRGRFSVALDARIGRAVVAPDDASAAVSVPVTAAVVQRTSSSDIRTTVDAKILSILVAADIRYTTDVESLVRCIRSIAGQSRPPQSLWVSWYASEFDVAAYVVQELEELAQRCVRRGCPLAQVRQTACRAPLEHVEDVLEKRQRMGGDVRDLWVQLGYPDALWHPRRCFHLARAAARAIPGQRAVWVSGTACSVTLDNDTCCSAVDCDAVDQLLADGRARAISADEATIDAILLKMAALAEFIAGAPPAALRHRLCDLALLSFARRETAGIISTATEAEDNPVWMCFRCDVSVVHTPHRVLRLATQHYVSPSGRLPPYEIARRASEALQTEEGLLDAVCRHAAEAIVFCGLYEGGDISANQVTAASFYHEDVNDAVAVLARSITTIVGVFEPADNGVDSCDDNNTRLEKRIRALLADVLEFIGRPHEPSEEEVGRLLRPSKPKEAAESVAMLEAARAEARSEERCRPIIAPGTTPDRLVVTPAPRTTTSPMGRRSLTIWVPLPAARGQRVPVAPLRLGLGLKDARSPLGALVDAITDPSARQRGFAKGDVIVSLDGTIVKNFEEFLCVFSKRSKPPFPPGALPLEFGVFRSSAVNGGSQPFVGR